MALTKLTSNLIEGGTGTDWVTAIQTSNFTAAAGKGYFVNTTSQVLYVNLPVGVVGMEITIQDYAGTFATNKVILNANGSEKIQGSALEGKINTNNATAVLIYQDATKGWTSQDVSLNQTEISWATPTGQSLTYSAPSPQSSNGAPGGTFPTTTFTATKSGEEISGTATIAGLPTGITATQSLSGTGAGNTLTVTLTGTFPSTNSLNTALTLSGLTVITPVTVEYLVVAGGGSGGGGGAGSGGGGGAGGYRTNYSGTALVLSTATNYTVTIGAGGASGGLSQQGNNGNDSTFNNITSTGGGRGGYASSPQGSSTGGSGGGGGGNNGTGQSGSSGNTPSTTPSQGNSGGNGVGNPVYYWGGGGGGGATNAGVTATGNSPGNGGAGASNSITGSAVNYAGGGGGGSWTSGTSNGIGGDGGGGTGGKGAGSAGNNGDANTGGGSGGGGQDSASGVGGSGIVILRYPNSFTISGLSGTTTTVGTDSVTKFTTAGTGNIQFN